MAQHRQSNFGDPVSQLTELQPIELKQWSNYLLHSGVAQKDGSEFTPDTLHHICCGIMHHLRQKGQPAIEDPELQTHYTLRNEVVKAHL